MHNCCVACLDPAPCSTKQGSFRWGFCKKSVCFQKPVRFLHALAVSSLRGWPGSGIPLYDQEPILVRQKQKRIRTKGLYIFFIRKRMKITFELKCLQLVSEVTDCLQNGSRVQSLSSEVFLNFLCAPVVYACLLCSVRPLHGRTFSNI
jgi:hypothetical protein